jgi:polar amino acid transport system substrate-binding protein
MKYFLIVLVSAYSVGLFAESKRPVFVFSVDIQEVFPSALGTGTEVLKVNPGIDIEMMRFVADGVDIDLKIKRIPWHRAKIELGKGLVSGVNGSYRPEREKNGVYPKKAGKLDPDRRIWTRSYMLYVKKGSLVRFDPEKRRFLQQTQPIGTPAGYSIARDLKKLGIDIAEAGTVLSNLQMLQRGRLDGVLVLGVQGDHFLYKHKKRFSGIVKSQPPVKSKDYFLVISHQFADAYPNRTQQIWERVRLFRKTRMLATEEKYKKLSR